MKKKTGKKKILIAVCALVLAAAIAAAVILPGMFQKSINNYSYVAEKQTGVDYSADFDITLKGTSANLMINSKIASVALVSSDGKTIFNSCSKDAAKYSLANVLSIRMRDKDGNSYTMNSTDNSVSFGTFEVKVIDKTAVSVKFNFFTDAKHAKNTLSHTDTYVSVPVIFSNENGNFKASVNTADIVLPEGNYIEKLSILQGLFSVNTATGNEFYTLPDGCGAEVDLSAVSEKPLTLDLGVYGSDVAFYDYSQGAVLPFFAMTKNSYLVNTIITNGDALSEISCKKFENGGGYLYNTFTITACGMIDGKFCAGESYEGEVSQVYAVTKGGTYNNISEQVRDNLITRGYLPDEISDKFIDMPFFINVLGSPDGKAVATTFEDAAEITAVLKTRGVRNIALRFSGANKNGLSSVSFESDTFSSDLGGKDGYNTMAHKITEQDNTAWLDINLYTGKHDGKSQSVKVYETPSKFAGFTANSFSLNSTNRVNANISECYKMISSLKSADICLNDASMILYTDLKGGLNRQQVLENIKEKASALSANGGLMLSYPAVYLMKEAGAVFNIPDTANCVGNEGVTAVPVLQMVLHGSVIYGSSYMNITNLSAEDALLKAIEYGSAPSFLFTHNSESNLNYNVYASHTAELYADAKKLLPVMDMKITSHELVVPGVYKTTYDYNKVVYVNYNPAVVEVNGVMISAKDYVII